MTMITSKLDISNPDHKALMKRIASGDVVLFTGSGFSLGAKGSLKGDDNEYMNLPSVDCLKSTLSREVLDLEYTKERLREICEDCKLDNKARYVDVLARVFKTTSICDFHREYAKIQWKEIYTINVDDVMERAHEGVKELRVIYKGDPVYSKKEDTLYYKLHGCALRDPENVVFATSDYVASSARSDYRFERLISALKTDYFLFVGTTLGEEWDFDIRCEQANIYEVRNRTYFVAKEFDEKLIRRLNSRFLNAVFIEETAESFIKKTTKLMDSNKDSIDSHYDKFNMRRIRKTDYDLTGYLKPDLYLGAEPTWEDVFSSHDVIWADTQKAIDVVDKQKMNRCVLIIGRPISGKTTLLYRLGVHLEERSTVYEYVGEDLVADLKNLGKSNNQNPTYILIDNANWVFGRIEDLIELAENNNVVLIMTIRTREYERRHYRFDDELLRKILVIEIENSLKKIDLKRYLEKLDEKSFLGTYGDEYYKSPDDTIDKLMRQIRISKEDPLLSLTRRIRYGNKLEERMNAIVDEISRHNNYNIKRFTILLYVLDVIGETGLKLSLFLDLYPMGKDDQEAFFVEAKDLLISNVNSISWKQSEYGKITIHCRLKDIAKRAIKRMPDEEIVGILLEILKRIDMVHHYKCRTHTSYSNYVLYTLLRSQNILQIMKETLDSHKKEYLWKRVIEIYESIKDNYQDYHMYWLHRGISEIKMKRFEAASIHLEQARAVRSGYSYEIEHAIARLYLEEAIQCRKLTMNERERAFEEGMTIIRSQIDREENDAFTIHSFVIKSIQYYNAIGKMIPEQLMRNILSIYYRSRKRFSFEDSKIRRNIFQNIYQYYMKNQESYQCAFSMTREELDYIGVNQNTVHFDTIDCL